FDSHKASEKGAVLDTGELIAQVAARGVPAFSINGAEEIVRRLAPELRAGDIVAVMSNGGFGGIHEKLLNALANSD
ncbi:MAG: UDP-N-acetylmuramate:L-alanyl-gamma-D-glutamyl-meso-diaminopimelate ligase, partial [Acidobacteriota bacterium]|nr:UDP-N-acetylmuramate:L-alanyl-gamma-D-glutamyl-meso-diaminopimelate ligase [Acidobacteriota bacterium]